MRRRRGRLFDMTLVPFDSSDTAVGFSADVVELMPLEWGLAFHFVFDIQGLGQYQVADCAQSRSFVKLHTMVDSSARVSSGMYSSLFLREAIIFCRSCRVVNRLVWGLSIVQLFPSSQTVGRLKLSIGAIENLLRSLIGDNAKQWDLIVTQAEFTLYRGTGGLVLIHLRKEAVLLAGRFRKLKPPRRMRLCVLQKGSRTTRKIELAGYVSWVSAQFNVADLSPYHKGDT
ncbi:hypothetical protein Tco_0785712 [Tanacetum coccineum]